MTTGDGLAMIAGAMVIVGWAAAWSSVRHAAIRAEALRRLGDGAWQTKPATRIRGRV